MYKVIIADDNALSIKGLEVNLDFGSINAQLVGSFLSGMDVLAYLDAHPDVDLVVSDIRMPHMTGLDLAREVLSRNKMIKIVLISAYDDFEYAQEALRIGVTDYVQKPIDYDELARTMQRALAKLEEERTVLRRLEAAQPELRKNFYLELTRLHPILDLRTAAREAQYLGIATQGGSFLCVAIAGEKSEDNIAASGTEAMLLNQFMQSDALSAWFGAKMDCHLISDWDGQLAILHDAHLNGPAMIQKVRALCEGFAITHKSLDAGLYFGIGTAQDSLWEISLSLDAARRAVNRRFICPDQQVFVESGDTSGMLPFLMRIAEVQGEIAQLLLRRDTAALDRMVMQLTQNVIAKLKDQNLIVPYVIVLVSGVLRQVSQEGVDFSDAQRTVSEFGTRGRIPVSALDIEDMLRGFFRQTADALDRSLQSYQQKLLGKVKLYIESHLPDSQLRLENIAQQVHVTPSHLSRIFKRSEGINVSDYITQKRIERAASLLLGTSESISYVSEQVGYASPYYFSACFKKVTGMTPSDYRKSG
jgi:two-component system response regulator YesN